MDKKEKFSIGEKVVRIGTTSPVMRIEGKTMRGGLPYKTVTDTWTCFWENNGPHWEEINETELELFSE